ncbi:MAG TPA: hypothetical protein VFA21_13460 [Pyrinomonadaceae bacterium]|jgi:Cu/Ag efflux protein CusF|nr:hypothetical protein [Pyrinomonadaceae bacterium]
MKKIFLTCAVSTLLLAAAASAPAQTTPQDSGAQRPSRQRVVGDVTAVDAASNTVTVHTDAGETVTVATDEKTAYLRLPPGETTLDKAAHVTASDVHVGDRVLAVGVSATGGPTPARQLILMGRAPARAFDPAHNLFGRVASVDAAKKQVVVQSRGRDNSETVTLDASGSVRFLRNAPDSTRASDAQPSSFADLKVGDQVRATGERSADGHSFRADEIIAGSFTRLSGQVTSVDAARGELTVKNEQTGQTVTVALGPHSTLRRITPEIAAAREEQARQRRQEREASAQANAGGTQSAGGDGGGRQRRDGQRGGGGGQFRGGGGFQQMLDSLPAVTVADLKKGDVVNVTGTPGADAAHVTAIMLITGDAETMRRMQPGQRGQGGRGMSPGLPGDVVGGGTGGGERVPPRR